MAIGEAFAEANVSPADLCKLIDETKELLNDISLEHDHSTHAFNAESRDDVIRMLKDLKDFDSVGQ